MYQWLTKNIYKQSLPMDTRIRNNIRIIVSQIYRHKAYPLNMKIITNKQEKHCGTLCAVNTILFIFEWII